MTRQGMLSGPGGARARDGSPIMSARVQSARVPVAWYRAEARDADVGELLRYLEVAFRRAIPSLTGPWRTVEEAVAALERLDPTGSRGRHLLVIDDLHTLE